jgi:hypothetical protein
MMSCQINNKRYFLIQVFLHNNTRIIDEAHDLCDYLKKKGHHFVINFTANENGSESEFLIEVDKQTFYDYKF